MFNKIEKTNKTKTQHFLWRVAKRMSLLVWVWWGLGLKVPCRFVGAWAGRGVGQGRQQKEVMCCKSTKSFELPDLGPQREMWVNVSICPRTWRGLSWNLISSFNFLNCKELGSIVVGQPAEVQVLSHREQDEQLSVPQSSYFQLGIIIFLKRCSFKVDRF